MSDRRTTTRLRLRPPASPPVLEARGLCAGYGSRPVGHDLTLSCGPRGGRPARRKRRGKTTHSARHLSGRSSGDRGSSMRGSPTRLPLTTCERRRHAFVTEERSSSCRMSTIDNIRVGRCDRGGSSRCRSPEGARASVRGGLLSRGEQRC